MEKDDEFPGVLIVDELTFERIKRDLQQPGKPTEAAIRGAKLLRDLYGDSSLPTEPK